MNKIKISFGIPVHNEHVELETLVNQLLKYLNEEDEIVVQGDQGRVTDEVVTVVRKFHKIENFKYIEYPLNNNFSDFKNNLIKNCSGDYVFQIDADEMVSLTLLENLKFLLFENSEVEAIRLPRLNIVIGLEEEFISKWGWQKNKMPIEKLDYPTKEILEKYHLGTEYVYAINWPDYQTRLFKNQENIRWVNKVHEQLLGMKKWANFPDDFDYCLFHVKHEKRQKQQNEFYGRI